jgi:hypothetical protein
MAEPVTFLPADPARNADVRRLGWAATFSLALHLVALFAQVGHAVPGVARDWANLPYEPQRATLYVEFRGVAREQQDTATEAVAPTAKPAQRQGPPEAAAGTAFSPAGAGRYGSDCWVNGFRFCSS